MVQGVPGNLRSVANKSHGVFRGSHGQVPWGCRIVSGNFMSSRGYWRLKGASRGLRDVSGDHRSDSRGLRVYCHGSFRGS